MMDRISDGVRRKLIEAAGELLAAAGGDLDEIASRCGELEIELPSWGMARGGTRFGLYRDGSEAETIEEKLEDCALVHRLTGSTPAVATHFPWDGADLGAAGKTLEAIRRNGLRPGAVNSNTFSVRSEGPLDWRLRFGSLTNPVAEVRRAALDHHLELIEIMRLFGSRTLSVWLPDGTNSPGQFSLFEQARLLEETLGEVCGALEGEERIFIEYKFFEPAFYATAIPDWGRAYTLAEKLGERAVVLVDLGHHPQGVNIEQIVAHLIHLGKFGGFHFNDRKYGDDDLATGSLDPAQLFRIFVVLLEADRRGLKAFPEVSLVIDQSHNVKNPIEETVESVVAIQRAYAQALLVDYSALEGARGEADPVRADQVLTSAFNSPAAEALLWKTRSARSLPPDPLAALRGQGAIVDRRRARKRAREAPSGESLGL